MSKITSRSPGTWTFLLELGLDPVTGQRNVDPKMEGETEDEE